MKTINKVASTYMYPSSGRGDSGAEVGFFLESRLDRFGNVLKTINITDKFGQVKNVPYSGKSLMTYVKLGLRTTSVRRTKRADLEKYKEAYKSYLDGLSPEDKELHEKKIYLFLEEESPETLVNESNKNIIDSLKQELEKAKTELAGIEKAKSKTEKSKVKPEVEPE